jgi:RimJ/RimL family protein N-acetyltransferase
MEIITIEELMPEHFELVAGWLSKGEINRWLTAQWRNRVVTATLIAMVVRDRKNRVFLVRCDSQPCGLAALADIDTVDGTAMVWYVLGEQTLAGRGIIADSVRQLTRLCFDQMRLASIYAWTMEDNTASTRVLQKVGFREAGRIRCAASSGGRQVDRVYFDLIASDVQAAVRPS